MEHQANCRSFFERITMDIDLVGGWASPLENIVSWDDESPKIWKSKKCSKPPARLEWSLSVSVSLSLSLPLSLSLSLSLSPSWLHHWMMLDANAFFGSEHLQNCQRRKFFLRIINHMMRMSLSVCGLINGKHGPDRNQYWSKTFRWIQKIWGR